MPTAPTPPSSRCRDLLGRLAVTRSDAVSAPSRMRAEAMASSRVSSSAIGRVTPHVMTPSSDGGVSVASARATQSYQLQEFFERGAAI